MTLNKKLITLFFTVLLVFSVHTTVSADFNCGQYKEAAACEGRTGRGCQWKQGECVFNQQLIDKPPAQGVASDSFGVIDPLEGKFDTPSSVVNELLPYVFSGAGIILFIMLIMGGFTMMTAATDTKKAEVGKSRITAAIIGFVIIFAAYWLVQILEILFGVTILN